MKLRNCPFCGGDARIKRKGERVRQKVDLYRVGCDTKKCPGIGYNYYKSEEEAEKAWNQRPDEVIGFFGDNLLAIVDGHPVLRSKVDIKKTAEQWGEPIPPIMVM